MREPNLKSPSPSNLKRVGDLLLFCLFALALAVPAAAEQLTAEVGLLVGRPDVFVQDDGVLVVPGTVIAAESDPRLDDVLSKPGGEEAARRLVSNTRLKQVAGNLKTSFRLSEVEVRYQMRIAQEAEEVKYLPPPSGSSQVNISVKLLGFNETTATYEVQFHEGSTPIADTPITIQRGKQAVVGSLDGEDAPYLFLVIAPAAAGLGGPATGPIHVGGDVQPPLALNKPQPQYSAEAKENGVQGVVVLQAVIDRTGRVTDVRVLTGLPHGLSEAAAEAIRQWQFEPATLAGEPVEVYYNLTVNFRLASDAERKAKSEEKGEG